MYTKQIEIYQDRINILVIVMQNLNWRIKYKNLYDADSNRIERHEDYQRNRFSFFLFMHAND